MCWVRRSLVLLSWASGCAPEQPSTRDSDCTVSVVVGLESRVPTVARVDVQGESWANTSITFEPVSVAGAQTAPRPPVIVANLAAVGPTWVVGLAPNTTYRYLVTSPAQTEDCPAAGLGSIGERTGELTTGAPPEDLPLPRVSERNAGELSGGFLVTSVSARGDTAATRSYLAAYDVQGHPVWWYSSPLSGLPSRVRWVNATRRVFAKDANPRGTMEGKVAWVSWDGSEPEVAVVDTTHHDFAVAPDGQLLLLGGGGSDRCGTLLGWRPGQSAQRLFDFRDAFGATFETSEDPCHCNAIDYATHDDSAVVSCLIPNAFIKLNRGGTATWKADWVLGGGDGESDFVGDVEWIRQHGLRWLNGNRLLFFNNNGGGDSDANGSLAVELELDLVRRTARRVWEYDGGQVSQTLGDVSRLSNGNTLVTYSNAGVVHEVAPDATLLRVWEFDALLGYLEHHEDLSTLPASGSAP